jgi:hypothetical protein
VITDHLEDLFLVVRRLGALAGVDRADLGAHDDIGVVE